MEESEQTRRAPAPWTLHGEAHGLLTWLPRAAGAQQRLGVLGFLRYTASDVGPYDELLWLAPWGLALEGCRLHTVEHIFVSSRASRDNGRLNWGVPKELASFDVQHLGPRAQRVQVSTAAGPLASFVITTGARSLSVDGAMLPRRARTLGQVLDGCRFVVRPHLRGRLHRAQFSELAGAHHDFVNLTGARALGACSLLELELLFPAAESHRIN